MVTALHDDLLAPDVIADPYTYLGRLREEDPIHRHEQYEVWIVTGYDDVVWLTRHPELFASAVVRGDPRPPYRPIAASDMGLFHEVVRGFFGDMFIPHDRPDHTEMRQVVHGSFTPTSMEPWRP